jgi:hypothetical protein
MPYEPIVPEGQHLGTSHAVDGAVTGHLFEDGTNDLKGHAAWRWVDEPEQDDSPSYGYEPPRELTPEERELAEKLAALILIGIIKGVETAAPHIRRWWSEKAAPTMRSAWERITASGGPRGKVPVAPPPALEEIRVVMLGAGAETVVAESKIKMSRAEWMHRFRAMVAAGAFQEERQRILANARVDDEDELVGSAGGLSELSPQQFADGVRLMLEANPSLLSEETSAELARVFSENALSPAASRSRVQGS